MWGNFSSVGISEKNDFHLPKDLPDIKEESSTTLPGTEASAPVLPVKDSSKTSNVSTNSSKKKYIEGLPEINGSYP